MNNLGNFKEKKLYWVLILNYVSMNIFHKTWNDRATSHCSWWLIRHVFWGKYKSFWSLISLDEVLIPEDTKLQKKLTHNQEIVHFVLYWSLELHIWEEIKSISAGDVHCISSWFQSEYFVKNNNSGQNLKYIECIFNSKDINIQPSHQKNGFWIAERRNNWHKQVENKEDVWTVRIHQDVLISRARIDSHTILPYRKSSANNKVFFFLLTGNLEIKGKNIMDRDSLEISCDDNIIPVYGAKLWWEIIAIELQS
mgnify:FL=1